MNASIGPAVTRSMHSVIRTHKCGLDRTPEPKLVSYLFKPRRDSTAQTKVSFAAMLHVCYA